ncbi:MAG: hypothetical protein U0Y68_24200 [Blastocatellia bacterium]
MAGRSSERQNPYVLGGQTEAVPMGMVYIYDIAANSWMAGATAPLCWPMPLERMPRGAWLCDGWVRRYYKPSTAVSAYDEKPTWISLPGMKMR